MLEGLAHMNPRTHMAVLYDRLPRMTFGDKSWRGQWANTGTMSGQEQRSTFLFSKS